MALAGVRLDGLVVALPHHAYTERWSELTNLSLPILKEEPLARTYDEAVKFLDSAKVMRCPIQTAIQRRHHTSYKQLRSLLRRGGQRRDQSADP